MGEFYNPGRSPTAATSSDGESICFSPRQWLYVPLAKESSASILHLISKKLLIRRDSPRDYPEVEEPIVMNEKPKKPIITEDLQFRVVRPIEEEKGVDTSENSEVAEGGTDGAQSTGLRSSRKR
jgi:hypothetical protein